jgi:hypothetical protein
MPSTVAQIEYGDFYKFVVSLGIALVVAAILTPWLFLREPFDLMIEASRLSQLTPVAQQIVLLRQTYLLRLLPVIPWFSFSLLMMGAGAISIGLMKWYNRQTLRDTSEDLGVQKQQQELRNMTTQEVREKADADVQTEIGSVAGGLVHDPNTATQLRAIEGVFHRRVRECFGASYRLLENQRLGAAEYDAILQPLLSTSPDVIVEIKYIRRGFRQAWLRESAMRLVLAKELYDAQLGRHSIPLLLVIFSAADASTKSEFLATQAKTQADLRLRGITLRIEYIAEDTIPTMSCDELARLIFG